jgi:site-specific recombinase XerD
VVNPVPKYDKIGAITTQIYACRTKTKYSSRVNAVVSMKVKDYFTQGRRGWVRLHEKGGKEQEVPCHHMLEKYIDEYVAAAEIAADTEGPLFRTSGRKTGLAHAKWQQDAYRMIQRRAAHAGIKTRIGNHTFRATGITAYLKNKGLLEHAQTLANHSSPRTTKLYDRHRRYFTRRGRRLRSDVSPSMPSASLASHALPPIMPL